MKENKNPNQLKINRLRMNSKSRCNGSPDSIKQKIQFNSFVQLGKLQISKNKLKMNL